MHRKSHFARHKLSVMPGLVIKFVAGASNSAASGKINILFLDENIPLIKNSIDMAIYFSLFNSPFKKFIVYLSKSFNFLGLA